MRFAEEVAKKAECEVSGQVFMDHEVGPEVTERIAAILEIPDWPGGSMPGDYDWCLFRQHPEEE